MKKIRLAFGLALLAFTVAAPAAAQVGLDLRSLSGGVVSRDLYRGYLLADDWTAVSAVDVGLGGYYVTGIGRWGIAVGAEGEYQVRTPVGSKAFGVTRLSARYERGRLNEAPWLRLVFRESLFSRIDGEKRASPEVELTLAHMVVEDETHGVNLRGFVDVAHDFNRYDGTYAAVGLETAMSLERKLFGYRSSAELQVYTAGSDFVQADLATTRSFGAHDTRVSFALPFEFSTESSRAFTLRPHVAYDWATAAIRAQKGFSGGVSLTWGAPE